MTNFLFRFSISYFCSFLAAIIVGLAINLFATLRLVEGELSIPDPIGYGAVASLLVSAIGLAVISWGLEEAKTEWILKGAPPSSDEIQLTIQDRSGRLWFGLVLGVVGFAYFLLLLFTKRWCPLS